MKKYCKCGCGEEITSKWQRYQEINYIKGHARRGKKNSVEHNLSISNANNKSIKVNCSYCKSRILRKPSKLKKFDKYYCDTNCYAKSLIGRKLPKEQIEKARLKRIGHEVSEETRKKISFANSGKKNGMFREDSDMNIRKIIRKRDNFICQLCDMHQEKNKKSLDVHHIDYNKKNNLVQNLISLCHSCHAKTNKSKRPFWIKHFHSILNNNYGYIYSDNESIVLNLMEINNEME